MRVVLCHHSLIPYPDPPRTRLLQTPTGPGCSPAALGQTGCNGDQQVSPKVMITLSGRYQPHLSKVQWEAKRGFFQNKTKLVQVPLVIHEVISYCRFDPLPYPNDALINLIPCVQNSLNKYQSMNTKRHTPLMDSCLGWRAYVLAAGKLFSCFVYF